MCIWAYKRGSSGAEINRLYLPYFHLSIITTAWLISPCNMAAIYTQLRSLPAITERPKNKPLPRIIDRSH